MSNDPHPAPSPSSDAEFGMLATSYLDGRIAPDDLARLNHELAHSGANRRLFVRMCLFVGVMSESLAPELADASESVPSSIPPLVGPFANEEQNREEMPHNSDAHLPPVSPFPAPLDAASAPFFTYLASGWPIAYLVATAIFAIGLVIGTIVHVSQPGQYVNPHRSIEIPSPQVSIRNPSRIVARVTGAVDCVWEGEGLANQKSEIRNQNSELHPGDLLALRSGLLEITYDTGAKVILQGPVRYQVESACGGYLSIGKLTARLNSDSEIPNPKSQLSNHPSEIINQKSFAVRTPTAVVTDLGTEFAVEVAAEGRTISHVFRGSVEVRTVGSAEGVKPAVRVLHANESAQVAPPPNSQSLSGEIGAVQVNPRRFVRQMPVGLPVRDKALPMQVVAWFRLGEDDPGALAGAPVTRATTNHCGHYPLTPRTRPTYSDNVAPTGSTLAMSFGGAKNECVVNSHVPYLMTEEFVLEAWVCVRKIEKYFQFIAYNGEPNRNGYGLLVGDGRWQFLLGRVRMVDSGVPCELGKWTHLALVCQRSQTQLWINGQPAGQPFVGQPNLPDMSFSIGCDHVNNPAMAFAGEIDEVRLSTLSGPFRPEMLLFRRSPPKGEKGGTER